MCILKLTSNFQIFYLPRSKWLCPVCVLPPASEVAISTGKHIAGFTQKKASAWQPQWTRDEALCYLRSPNNEIVVYKNGDFSVVDKRLSIAKLESFSASPGNNSGANKAYPG